MNSTYSKNEILIVLLNPLLDITYFYKENSYKIGLKHFADYVSYTSGGMGINMARALSILKTKNIVFTMFGGITGDIVKRLLKKERIRFKHVGINKETRVASVISNKKDKMFVSPSPFVTNQELELFKKMFFSRISKNNTESNIVVIGGSLPNNCLKNTYSLIIKKLKKKQMKVFLDIRDNSLVEAIKERPFLIKLNDESLNSLISKDNLKIKEKLQYIYEIHCKGVDVIIYTGNFSGMFVFYNNKVYRYSYPIKLSGNFFGLGDTFFAGLVSAFSRSFDIDESIKFGISCGTSSFLESNKLGYFDLNEVEKLKDKIKVNTVRINK